MHRLPKCKCGSTDVALWDQLSKKCKCCGQYVEVQWICSKCGKQFTDVALVSFADGRSREDWEISSDGSR